jgi:hypothetical protein
MTDSNDTPSPASTSTRSDYEGTDPDLRTQKESPRSGISTVQVGASAAAAVTSALAASVFGVAGTVIGAAVGSIVSTIAGALYTDYLGRAQERLKVVTTEVVIQRIPGEVIASTPLRHLTAPNDLPGGDSMRPIGAENNGETVAVPLAEAGELRKVPDDKALLRQTSVLPAVAQQRQSERTGSRPAPTATLWWRKPVTALSAVSLAGFLIASGVLLSAEGVLGHPVSGGTSGNSFSKFTNVGSNTDSEPSKSEPKPTSTETSTGTPSTDESDETDEAPPSPTESPTGSEDGTGSTGGTDSEGGTGSQGGTESDSAPTEESEAPPAEEAPNGADEGAPEATEGP